MYCPYVLAFSSILHDNYVLQLNNRYRLELENHLCILLNALCRFICATKDLGGTSPQYFCLCLYVFSFMRH
jgi:hypothetical protein